jgi:hypothetical protein
VSIVWSISEEFRNAPHGDTKEERTGIYSLHYKSFVLVAVMSLSAKDERNRRQEIFVCRGESVALREGGQFLSQEMII